MRVIVTKRRIVTFDLNEERERIKRAFSKKKERLYRDKLLEVIDVFEEHGYDKAVDVYDDLPYNDVDEYPLQESMGEWWWQINGHSMFAYEDNVKHEYEMQIIKDNQRSETP